MVFVVRAQPAFDEIHRRPFQDRPADQHALHLEAEVVVQPRCPMLLHNEAVSSASIGCTFRLGRLAELAFSLVLGKRTRHPTQFARMVRWHQSSVVPRRWRSMLSRLSIS